MLVIEQTNASFPRKCSLTFQSKNELASLNFKAYLILPLNECYSEFCCDFAVQPIRNQFSWLVQGLISLNNVAVSMRLKCLNALSMDIRSLLFKERITLERFAFKCGKPKPNKLLWPITRDVNSPMNQSQSKQIHVTGAKRGKTRAAKSTTWFCFSLVEKVERVLRTNHRA